MNFKKIYCFYHTDMDGKTSAWNVHKWADKHGIKNTPVNFQRHNYSDPWKTDYLDKETLTFIVDLSFTKVEELEKICSLSKHVVWIDHHQSSQDMLNIYGNLKHIPNITILVNNNGSGALLTHIWCSTHEPHTIEPIYNDIDLVVDQRNLTAMYGFDKVEWGEMLSYVDDYDRWAKVFPNSDYFILGTNTEDYTTAFAYKNENGAIVFNDNFWDKAFADPESFVNNGKIIKKYLNNRYAMELRNAFEVEVTGSKILCLNSRGNSWCFCDKIKEYDAVCIFSFNGSIWLHSVYSDEKSKFDCAKFCETYGGGGHRHAAGFQSDKPVFIKYNK